MCTDGLQLLIGWSVMLPAATALAQPPDQETEPSPTALDRSAPLIAGHESLRLRPLRDVLAYFPEADLSTEHRWHDFDPASPTADPQGAATTLELGPAVLALHAVYGKAIASAMTDVGPGDPNDPGRWSGGVALTAVGLVGLFDFSGARTNLAPHLPRGSQRRPAHALAHARR